MREQQRRGFAVMYGRMFTAVAVQVGVWGVMQFVIALCEGKPDMARVYAVVVSICAYAVAYRLMNPRANDD